MLHDEGRRGNGDARRLLDHLFDGTEGLLCITTGTRKNGELQNIKDRFYRYPAQAENALEHALRASERGREAYFCTALLKTAENRKKGNALPLPALYIDGDGAKIPEDLPDPTAIVETSPGKHHYYYRLRNPLDAEEFAGLNKRLTYYVGADKGGHDVGQVLRVPGTTNHKPEAEEFIVSLVELRDGEMVQAGDLDRLLPPVQESRNGHKQERRTSPDNPPVKLTGKALRVWRGEEPVAKNDGSGEVDRSGTLMSIGRHLYNAGATRQTIVAALEERDRSLGYQKYTGRSDQWEQYEAIVDKLEESPRHETVEMGGPHRGEDPPETYELTDVGNAFRFRDRYRGRVRYCYPFKRFLIFDGKRWVLDPGGIAEQMAIKVALDIHHEAARTESKSEQAKISRWAITSQSETRIAAMLKLARSFLRIEPEEFDDDPLLFNCANGTIDLRTGKVRDHRREDYLTKISPISFDPDAQAGRFERFLSEIFDGRQTLIDFTRRYAGSSASGLTKDRAFVILHGAGKNGKTTLLELLRGVLGDYAKDTPIESIMQNHYEGVGNDVAALRGARFVTASESDKGKKLAVAKIKKLVGSDKVTARFLFQEFFEFKPELKLWIATNHKPVIEETTEAIWDRVNLLPFDVRFEGDDEDDKLLDKLQAESPGVLAWIIRGCLEWQRDGLNPPEEVQTATKEYRKEMDPVGRFLEEECERNEKFSVKYSHLWRRWEAWAEQNGEEISKKALSARLQEEGFERDKFSGDIYYSGLALQEHEKAEDDRRGGGRRQDDYMRGRRD
jgi:P4 family phage/plasmid primase-like protien